MRIARILGLPALALALEGCAAVGLAVVGGAAGVGAGAGVEHTMNGIVYKTFDAPTNELRFATLDQNTTDTIRKRISRQYAAASAVVIPEHLE